MPVLVLTVVQIGLLLSLGMLPGWAQTIAPATPIYWAMRGFGSVTLDRRRVR